MNWPARLIACIIVVATVFSSVASAQVNLQPTPQPLVTAENETWYRTGDPVMFAGNIYYPAGPAIHFNGDEMVRSGFYKGIPLYSRTTIEPYSVVFVPIGGGMMQPYERRRTGELAGTSGSTVSALPVEIPSPIGSPAEAPIFQAPAPPVVASQPVLDELVVPPPQPAATGPVQGRVPNRAPRTQVGSSSPSVGTSGRVASSSRPATIRTRPQAANGIFVEFQNGRWYSSGPPASLDPRVLTRIGDWYGFPVYVASGAGDSTLYIPIAQGLELLAPYSKRR
jgi:hypothetical protein